MNNDEEPKQSEPQVAQPCQCQGDCTCGTKYRLPVYYEVNVNDIVDSLADWD